MSAAPGAWRIPGPPHPTQKFSKNPYPILHYIHPSAQFTIPKRKEVGQKKQLIKPRHF